MNWTSRVRAAFAEAGHVPDDEVIEELAQHARAMYEAARADACSHDEADARVREQVERWQLEASALKHRTRRAAAVDPPPAVESPRFAGLAQDIRYAARLLRRQPRFSMLVASTMALGIGATTVLFSVTYGVLMKPLPWPAGDRLVVLEETRGGKSPRFGAFTNAAYLAWRERATTIDGIAAWSQRTVTLGSTGEPERIRITAASASLFPVLGVRPLIGAFFEENEEVSPSIVLSESLWQQRFGGDVKVLGTVVQIDGTAHTVVGVLPEKFAYPDRQSRAWVPFPVRPATNDALSMFSAVARLRTGVSPEQAAAEGTGRGRFAPDTGLTTTAIFGGAGPIQIVARPWRDAQTSEVRQPLLVLLAASSRARVEGPRRLRSLCPRVGEASCWERERSGSAFSRVDKFDSLPSTGRSRGRGSAKRNRQPVRQALSTRCGAWRSRAQAPSEHCTSSCPTAHS